MLRKMLFRAALAALLMVIWAKPAHAQRTTRWLKVTQQSDVTANDSDKTFTVPTGKTWRILGVFIKNVTSGDVGNRAMLVTLTDASDNELLVQPTGVVQAASTTRYYTFAPGLPNLGAFVATDKLTTSFANEAILPAGYKIRVRDGAAIAATADDMDVRIMVEEMIE